MKDVLDTIGQFGRWQLFFLMYASYRGVLTGLNNMAYVFLVTGNDHWCDGHLGEQQQDEWKQRFVPYDKGMGSYSQCEMYHKYYNQSGHLVVDNGTLVACDAWAYEEHPFGKTLTTDWNLVCDRRWMRSLVQSVYMAFLMIGVLIYGVISDRWGRRLTLYISAPLLTLSSMATVFSPNLYYFLVSRIGIGLGISGLQVGSFSLLAESVGPKYRIALNIAYGYGWSVGMVLLPGIVWLVRDWRKVMIACAALSLPAMLLLPWVYESPRWLLTTGDTERTLKTIRKIARFNKRNCDDLEKKVELLIEDKKRGCERNKQSISVLGLFQSPLLRRNTSMLVVCSFLYFIVYYGFAKSSTTIGGNPYLSYTMSSLLEATGYTISLATTKYFRRRTTIVVSYLLFGATMLWMALTAKENVSLRITLMVAGRSFFTIAFTTMFVFLNEIFPTVARSGGFGLYTTVGRLGATLEPWISNALSSLGETFVLAAYCVMILTISVICMMLPETFERELPDTLEEGEKMCRKRVSTKETARGEMELGDIAEELTAENVDDDTAHKS
ncbi:solute carrier family 22 member 6-like isoform X1 [Ornithodoros turicata]|uniref:solute carrier family 22 member 6-like isoform X1 n=2 Tax=Ornithodoros turicata TaxID=34597 RepID=UPI0031387CF2